MYAKVSESVSRLKKEMVRTPYDFYIQIISPQKMRTCFRYNGTNSTVALPLKVISNVQWI